MAWGGSCCVYTHTTTDTHLNIYEWEWGRSRVIFCRQWRLDLGCQLSCSPGAPQVFSSECRRPFQPWFISTISRAHPSAARPLNLRLLPSRKMYPCQKPRFFFCILRDRNILQCCNFLSFAGNVFTHQGVSNENISLDCSVNSNADPFAH